MQKKVFEKYKKVNYKKGNINRKKKMKRVYRRLLNPDVSLRHDQKSFEFIVQLESSPVCLYHQV